MTEPNSNDSDIIIKSKKSSAFGLFFAGILLIILGILSLLNKQYKATTNSRTYAIIILIGGLCFLLLSIVNFTSSIAYKKGVITTKNLIKTKSLNLSELEFVNTSMGRTGVTLVLTDKSNNTIYLTYSKSIEYNQLVELIKQTIVKQNIDLSRKAAKIISSL